jgi:PAS domain S-box-containing protein
VFVSGAKATPPPVVEADQKRIAELLDGFGDGFVVLDREWRILHCNAAAQRHFNAADAELAGATIHDVAPEAIQGELASALSRAMDERCSVQGEAEVEGHPGRWVAFRAFPVEHGIGVGFRDVSEQRARRRRSREQSEHLAKALARVEELESRHAFVLQLSDTLRSIDDPETILGAAAGMIGERMGASRAGYSEVAPGGRNMVTGGNWVREGLPTFTNRPYPKEAFGKKAIAQLEAGKIVKVVDVQDDPRTADAKATYAAMDVRSFVSIPLMRDGVMEASFSLMAPDPREWTEEEVRLVEEVASRTWATLQQARSERAVRESEARFRSMADCAPAPVWVTSAAGDVEFVNQAYSSALAAPPEKLLGHVWLDMIHPEDRPHVVAVRAEARKNLEPYTFEARMMHPDGQYRIMRASSRPRFDEHGVFLGYVGMSIDITAARRAEERQNLLIKELNHRVKNTLATVQSIVHQILRKDAIHGDTRHRITERLIALSSAHDVLTRQSWQHADLMEVIREAIRPFTDPQAPRIELAGPPVRLTPNVAVALAMALHELGANAVRYGSLSAPSGHVRISWRVAEAGGLELEWRERGGPIIVGPPTETGFGSRLLEGLIADLGKAAELEFTPTGVVCRLSAPIAKN